MKRRLKLWTSAGRRLRIVLENWSSGLDNTHRRWILGDGYWQCLDTGEVARKTRSTDPETPGFGEGGDRDQTAPSAAEAGPSESAARYATIARPRGQTAV